MRPPDSPVIDKGINIISSNDSDIKPSGLELEDEIPVVVSDKVSKKKKDDKTLDKIYNEWKKKYIELHQYRFDPITMETKDIFDGNRKKMNLEIESKKNSYKICAQCEELPEIFNEDIVNALIAAYAAIDAAFIQTKNEYEELVGTLEELNISNDKIIKAV